MKPAEINNGGEREARPWSVAEDGIEFNVDLCYDHYVFVFAFDFIGLRNSVNS